MLHLQEHCRGLVDGAQDRDREQRKADSAGVFSIPGPFFTDVNYSNDQRGDSAHPVHEPGQEPISPEGEGGRKGGQRW